jgi:hypothetical protein
MESNEIQNFVGEHRIRNSDGSVAVYKMGDVVTRKGKTYVAVLSEVSGFSPEHGEKNGWKVMEQFSSMRFFNSETTPLSANEGDHWFDSSVGNLYIYVLDDDTEQWIEF